MWKKRKGPKSSRSGCLFCKPHKRQGSPLKERDKPSLKRKLQEKPILMTNKIDMVRDIVDLLLTVAWCLRNFSELEWLLVRIGRLDDDLVGYLYSDQKER